MILMVKNSSLNFDSGHISKKRCEVSDSSAQQDRQQKWSRISPDNQYFSLFKKLDEKDSLQCISVPQLEVLTDGRNQSLWSIFVTPDFQSILTII